MLSMPWTLERKFLIGLRLFASQIALYLPRVPSSSELDVLKRYQLQLAKSMLISDTISFEVSEERVQLLYSWLEMLLAYLNFAPNIAKIKAGSELAQAREKVREIAMAMVMLIKRERYERENQYRFSYSPLGLSELMLLARFWHSRDRSETEVDPLFPWCRHIVTTNIDCLSPEIAKDYIRMAMMIEAKSKVVQGLETLCSMRPRPWASIVKAVGWLVGLATRRKSR